MSDDVYQTRAVPDHMRSTGVVYRRFSERLRGDIAARREAYLALRIMFGALGTARGDDETDPSVHLRRHEAITKVIDTVMNVRDEAEAARAVFGTLDSEGWAACIETRFSLLGNQVVAALEALDSDEIEHAVDFGCGAGAVYERVCDSIGIASAFLDAYDPFVDPAGARECAHEDDIVTQQVDELRTRYDFAYVLTVLHHAEDPEAILDWLAEHADAIFIVESIHEPAVLSPDVQALVDWLYNRGLHPDEQIPVPANYFTAEKLVASMEARGFVLHASWMTAADVAIVPECHWAGLFVRRAA